MDKCLIYFNLYIIREISLLKIWRKTFFKNIERVARRKLLQLHAATELSSLRVPPGNHLEALKDDRKGLHSIRVNDQWRICFVWREDGVHDVEICRLPLN